MDTCIFCKIVGKQIPARIEYEDDLILAFRDIHPQAAHHLLVIPKEHIESVGDVRVQHESLLGRLVRSAQILAQKLGFADQGYQLLIRSGKGGGQEVMHLHMHVLSGRKF